MFPKLGKLAESLSRLDLIYLYLLLLTFFLYLHFIPLPIYCLNFSQCTHRLPPHRSPSSLLLDTALPLISGERQHRQAALKLVVGVSALPCCLLHSGAPAPPRQRQHLLYYLPFASSSSSSSHRLPFHSVFGTFSPHLFIESVHGEI